MKNLFLILLSSVCFNICYGQNELLFKKNPHRLINNQELPKPGLLQNWLSGDLTERVDSAWTRSYGYGPNGWGISGISHFTYTNENLLAKETYLYYEEDGDPYQASQEEYFYDDQGFCTLHYTNKLPPFGSAEWTREGREEVFWNEDSLADEYIRSEWNHSLAEFEYISKTTSTYTPSKQTDENYHFTWDGTNWKSAGRQKYEYNNADSIQVINHYTWDEGSGEWVLNYKSEFFYTNDTYLDSIIDFWDMGEGLDPYSKLILLKNEQGLVESDIYYRWNESDWEPSALSEYEYTPEGKETLYTYYEWDADEERFVEDVYEENTFTAAGDPKRYTYAEYDTETETWIPWDATEVFYDENVDGSTIVWPNPAFYEPISFHQKPIFEVASSFYIDTWYDSDTTFLFYGNLTSATIPVSKLNVHVYPNPCSDHMTIEMEELGPGATITFFDQQGKFVSSRPVRSNVPVSISGLIPGAYVYQIRNGTEFYSGKILKE